MDYAKLAIIIWIISSLVIGILSRKTFFKIFEISQNKYVKVEWRGYLFCVMILGAAAAVGITLIVKAFSAA